MKLKIGILDQYEQFFRNTVFQISVDVSLKSEISAHVSAADQKHLCKHATNIESSSHLTEKADHDDTLNWKDLKIRSFETPIEIFLIWQ